MSMDMNALITNSCHGNIVIRDVFQMITPYIL